MAARDDRYGVVLNVQRGPTMRFECHVDSNPLTGLLFCTKSPGGGGGLVLVGKHDAGGDRHRELSTATAPVIRPHAKPT